MVDLLTNDSKDAQYVGSKDDQEVDEKEQNESNGDVARPVECLIRKRHLLDRSPYLKKKKKENSLFHTASMKYHRSTICVS